MKRLLLSAALATSVCATTANFAQAKRDPDVQKTLQRAYPGAQTQVMGNETINGVKVYTVNIADKSGAASSAQVTEFGDFLLYGAPQHSKELTKQIQTKAGEMFQTAPSDIQLFRSTSYLIDVPTQAQGKGKAQTYQIRLDPVGRVLDIKDAKATAADRPAQQQEVKDANKVKALEKIARDRYVEGDAQLQAIRESDVEGFYEADFKGAAVTLNDQGQILQVREDVKGPDLPEPVRKALDQLVKSSTRAQRVEEEYFQFTQQSATGNAVTVKMRADGDILQVVNAQAQQEEEAVVAKHKQKGGAAATPGKKAS